jgi:hypothetical protein
MWPFGKSRNSSTRPGSGTQEPQRSDEVAETAPEAGAPAVETWTQDRAQDAASSYDPVNGSFGPFDGDSVDYKDFDFSDFAKGGLDLGSMLIPVPHKGEVQVEMGKEGPRQIHILTPFGRITPAAFAAPAVVVSGPPTSTVSPKAWKVTAWRSPVATMTGVSNSSVSSGTVWSGSSVSTVRDGCCG